ARGGGKGDGGNEFRGDGLLPKTWPSLNGDRTTAREPGSDPMRKRPGPERVASILRDIQAGFPRFILADGIGADQSGTSIVRQPVMGQAKPMHAIICHLRDIGISGVNDVCTLISMLFGDRWLRRVELGFWFFRAAPGTARGHC